jgi:uncharacterized protein
VDQVLHVGTDTRWPLDAVTETFAIVGKRGSGKTSVAVVLAEEMLAIGQRILVVDPTGVWWGLGRDASGRRAGNRISVVGGDHGDEPLYEEDAGQLAARASNDEGALVVDTSEISRAEARRFTARLLEALHRTNRTPMHVFLDEADLMAPQRTARESAAVLTATDDLVRRGRVRGLGVTLISQRPAVLHKDVLTQVSTLIAMQLPAPQDAEAIDRWVRQDSDDHARRRMLEALPALAVGTGYVWSPGWLGTFGPVAFRHRTTLDTAATPTVAPTRPPAAEAQPDEPAGLRDAAPHTAAPGGRLAPLRADDRGHRCSPGPTPLSVAIDRLANVMEKLTASLGGTSGDTAGSLASAPRLASVPLERSRPQVEEPPERPHGSSTFERLDDDEQRILELVTLHGSVRPCRLAVWAGRTDVDVIERAARRLRRGGLIGPGHRIELTDAGRSVIGPRVRPVQDGEEAVRWWRTQLAPSDAAVLELAATCGPVPLASVAAEVGVGRHEVATICARLVTLGLVQSDGDRVAATHRTASRARLAARG